MKFKKRQKSSAHILNEKEAVALRFLNETAFDKALALLAPRIVKGEIELGSMLFLVGDQTLVLSAAQQDLFAPLKSCYVQEPIAVTEEVSVTDLWEMRRQRFCR